MTAEPARPVLILGGGINGAALARELVLNRVPVCLVDAADLASGATSASSRLIHGGLRYLEYGEFDLVRESLQERKRLLRLAPQFVHPLRLYIPIERRWGGLFASALKFISRRSKQSTNKARGLWLVRMGLWMYDRYAHDPQLPRPQIQRLSRVGPSPLPAVDGRKFRWLGSYYDAQIDYPERFVVALLSDARQAAAIEHIPFSVYTYHRAELQNGRVSLFPAQPASGGAAPTEVVTPAAIVNATGAWVDRTLSQLAVPSNRLIGGTKGSHLVTAHTGLRSAIGDSGIYAEAPDGRPFFILPLGTSTLVGTTDLPFDDDPQQAVATGDELDYLLSGVNRVFPQLQLTRHDIDFHYSGVRPLPYVGPATPGGVTRRHWLEEHTDCEVPTFSVIGGKLTTCRSLAEAGAAKILARLGRKIETNSKERVLSGGESYPTESSALLAEQERISHASGRTLAQVQAVWRLCGTQSADLLPPNIDVSEGESVTGTDLPRCFVKYVIRNEWVTHLTDLVERRLMLLYDRRLSTHTLRELAALLAAEGRMGTDKIEAQVQACLAHLETKYARQLPR